MAKTSKSRPRTKLRPEDLEPTQPDVLMEDLAKEIEGSMADIEEDESATLYDDINFSGFESTAKQVVEAATVLSSLNELRSRKRLMDEDLPKMQFFGCKSVVRLADVPAESLAAVLDGLIGAQGKALGKALIDHEASCRALAERFFEEE